MKNNNNKTSKKDIVKMIKTKTKKKMKTLRSYLKTETQQELERKGIISAVSATSSLRTSGVA